MKNVYLFEICDVTAQQVKLPYSTGLIWGYCHLNETIVENYKLDGWFYYREDMEEIIERLDNPSVIGFSDFVWNTQYDHKIAKRIKERYPNCVIVFGGQGTPKADRVSNFFRESPYVDIAVHGEGEVTFEDILIENLKEKPDFKNVLGCSIRNSDLSAHTTLPRPRIDDIDSMPSPYLDGLFDSLVENKDHEYDFEGAIETVRGCPYRCTFCDIGDLYFQKIKKQSNEKVFKELDWLVENSVEFLYNADSNFGMFKEHKDIVKYMTDLKSKTGYPDNIRVDWAKAKADKVIDLAKLLTDANMMKGITIALQSMSPEVLGAVRRKNIDGGKLKLFFDLYKDENLKTYIELILGLPKETVKSFKDGIFEILDLEYYDYIGVYPMTVLPNTPFAEPEYVKEYGIDVTETLPAFFHHDYPQGMKDETSLMVVGHKTLTRGEYIEMSMWRWLFMFGHNLGYLQYTARFLKSTHKIEYRKFYEKFYTYMIDNPNTLVGREYLATMKRFKGIIKRTEYWGRSIDEVKKDYYWDFEEATALVFSMNENEWYKDLSGFLKQFELDKEVEDDILNFQHLFVSNPFQTYPVKKEFNYNIKDVLFENKTLKNSGYQYTFDNKNYNSDLKKWCKEMMWWGRRNMQHQSKVL
ncbi:hypothetical protein CMI37_33860 [Candidatus Pacearchaeota archaeon]|nr:hypothetical protein [Candidatus Pacearchaeota archaeon]